MKLIIDVGNTLVKCAVFQDSEIVEHVSFKLSRFVSELKSLRKAFPAIEKAIISSVGRLNERQLHVLRQHFKLLQLNSDTKLPFKNLYATPKTLGVDRLALVSASVKFYPDKNVLIIDAGTCVTYDFITSENHYLGGAISPGLRLRYKVLNNLTANLPLLDTKAPEHFIGNSTNEAIHSGVVNGLSREIDGVINDYGAKYPDLTVILTGGDAKLLSNQLKNSIFAVSNFLLEGLNFILDYNSK
ncbi:type III pantothenate kinase [Winogradskyella maritima]|uniref:Type III pantothenate kinase n=1 Tax=Winogradskyella maritima TaxID=1517766 RepID=A0ABV8AJ05_9FLAO|nr:type III pantothenate kinase [Winogradskyella maritima]